MDHAFRFGLFDLDGTLLDSASCVVEATRAAFGAHGLGPPAEAAIRGQLGVPVERSFPELGAAECAGGTARAHWPSVIASFRSIYCDLAPARVRPIEGIPELLETLHANGVVLVVVTSKRRAIAEADCARTGLAPFLAGVVGSDCAARPKPDAEPARVACARYGISARARTLVLGDAPVDMQMGRAAGLATCAALWAAHTPGALLAERPDLVAHEPGELYGCFGLEHKRVLPGVRAPAP